VIMSKDKYSKFMIDTAICNPTGRTPIPGIFFSYNEDNLKILYWAVQNHWTHEEKKLEDYAQTLHSHSVQYIKAFEELIAKQSANLGEITQDIHEKMERIHSPYMSDIVFGYLSNPDAIVIAAGTVAVYGAYGAYCSFYDQHEN
jgi:hypothetical protein